MFEFFPIWVSRTSASGHSYFISLRWWQVTAAKLLVLSNVIAWGCIGLYEAVRVFV